MRRISRRSWGGALDEYGHLGIWHFNFLAAGAALPGGVIAEPGRDVVTWVGRQITDTWLSANGEVWQFDSDPVMLPNADTVLPAVMRLYSRRHVSPRPDSTASEQDAFYCFEEEP